MADIPKNLRNAGKGRPKGSKNKLPIELREMILKALDGAGGNVYLQQQAIDNPPAFLALLGKVVPKEVKLPDDAQFTLIINRSGKSAA